MLTARLSLLLPLAAALAACDAGPAFTETRSFTSTVAVAGARQLILDLPLSLDLSGTPTSSTAVLKVDVTVTASTSTKARAVARGFALKTVRESADVLRITTGGTDLIISLRGTVTGRLPALVNLVAGSSDAVRVRTMDRSVQVVAGGPVEVQDARDNLVVQSSGSIVATTRALPSTTTQLQAAGAIQLGLPTGLSAVLTAVPGPQSAIQIGHPALPQPVPDLTYRVVVGSGQATIELQSTGAGIAIGVAR